MGWLWTWSAVFVVAGLAVLASANSLRYRRRIAHETRSMLVAAKESAPVELEGLPGPVRRYLSRAVDSRDVAVRAVRLRHGGVFRTKVDGPWLSIQGEQSFRTTPPAFIWWGRIRMAPGVWVDARDRSVDGAGSMRVSLESTFTVGDASGSEVDQGAMLRLLREMVWFPTSFADARYLRWSFADEQRARATLRIGERHVSALFEFGADGLPARISADRYRDAGGGKLVLTPWSGEFRDFRPVEGILVPHELESFWQVGGTWIPVLRFEVESLEFDRG